jgi:hypothetical protein
MPTIHTTGCDFALDLAGLHYESPFVLTAGALTTSGEALPLLLVADPVEHVPGAAECAQDLLRGMAVYLRHTLGHNPLEAITTAFNVANEAILAGNRERAGQKRLYLGLSCVLLRGDEIFIAQCAPSQVLVWQDGHLHALPSLSTWSALEVTGTFSDLSYPLGFRSSVQPHVFYSRSAPGDFIAAISWPLARRLGRPDVHADRIEPSRLLSTVADLDVVGSGTHYLHGAVYGFSDVTRTEPFGLGHAQPTNAVTDRELTLDGSVNTGDSMRARVSTRQSRRFGEHESDLMLAENWSQSSGRSVPDFDTLGSRRSHIDGTDELPNIRFQLHKAAGDASVLTLPASTARFSESNATRTTSRLPGSASHDPYSAVAERRDVSARPAASRGRIMEIFAGLLLSLSAAVVGVWQITKRDRPIHGPRDDGTLGLPHLQKWSDSYQAPRFERVRRASPRFQVNGFLITGLLLAVLAVSVALIVNAYNNRSDGRAASIEERLQTITAVRAQSESAVNSRSAYESLTGAQFALDDLAAVASSDEMLERIQEEQVAVSETLASLTATEYLTSVQVMGSLPPVPEGVTPRLFKGNNRIFVLSGGLFELDQISGTLVQLLNAGDVVGGSPVGTLLAAAWNDDRPLVVDSLNAFLLDPATGDWHRVPLGLLSPEGYANITAAAAFGRSIYYLTAESGHILKFDALDFSGTPEDWTAGSSRDYLYNAVDLIVDGSIHVVLGDGQVLTFFRSAIDKVVSTGAIPPLDSVTAFTTIAGGEYFFMINASDGRIVGVDREGTVVRQFVTAPGVSSLAGATDLAVNESNGITYVISGDTLFAVRLSLPGR